MKVKVP